MATNFNERRVRKSFRLGDTMKNILKRVAIGLAGAGTMGLVVLLAAPTAVRSAVATFVSVVGNVAVMNPNDSNTGFPQPLLTKDYDLAAHTAGLTTQTCTFGGFGVCQTPALRTGLNSAAVLEDISGTCTFQGVVSGADITSIELLFGDSGSGNPTHPVYFSPTSEVSVGGGKTIYFGRPIHYVLNETSEPATLTVVAGGPGSGSCTVTYAGYNVDTRF
jgi:hypothetical protein